MDAVARRPPQLPAQAFPLPPGWRYDALALLKGAFAADVGEGDPAIWNLPAHTKGLGRRSPPARTACRRSMKKTCNAARARASPAWAQRA